MRQNKERRGDEAKVKERLGKKEERWENKIRKGEGRGGNEECKKEARTGEETRRGN